MKHAPKSAAKAVKALIERTSHTAKTWEQYFEGSGVNFHTVYLLVCEQIYGAGKTPKEPSEQLAIQDVIAEEMPELFAEYWEKLPRSS